ncbi:MAG TPA: DUF1385 domain-containing protein [Solirubrobacteraceae bacterium]|nr:DUF1385 domain-containing protein [Solirubrobacteraceae bacterium]
MSSPSAGGTPASPVQQPGAEPASEQLAALDGNGGLALARAEAAGAATVEADGELSAQRDAPVGGQAVLEGVMMRGVGHWAVAVRKPSPEQLRDDDYGPTRGAEGEIDVSVFALTSALQRHRWLRVPIIRGVVALAGSLVVGFRALEISANAQLPDEELPAAASDESAEAIAAGEVPGARERGREAPQAQEIPPSVWIGTVVVALALAVGLFFVVPVLLTSAVKDQLGSPGLFWVVEGVVRTAIFVGYLLLLSRMRNLRRVFEYHGAEHKTISCFEAGLALTPVNCQRFSRLHPRCGTSFLLVVMIVAIFVFAPLGLPAWYWLLATRILGVPLIAGISFELIKLAGKNRRRRWVRAVMWPGLKLQLLTTREPELDQLAVAIAALEAVLEREPVGALTAEDMVGVEVVA